MLQALKQRNKSFENKEKSLDKMEFGRWLAYLINNQVGLIEMKEANKNNKNATNNNLLSFLQEKKLWKIASVLDEFNQETIAQKVKILIEKCMYICIILL